MLLVFIFLFIFNVGAFELLNRCVNVSRQSIIVFGVVSSLGFKFLFNLFLYARPLVDSFSLALV